MIVPVIKLEVFYNDETKKCEMSLTEGNAMKLSMKEYKELLRQAVNSITEEDK